MALLPKTTGVESESLFWRRLWFRALSV